MIFLARVRDLTRYLEIKTSLIWKGLRTFSGNKPQPWYWCYNSKNINTERLVFVLFRKKQLSASHTYHVE